MFCPLTGCRAGTAVAQLNVIAANNFAKCGHQIRSRMMQNLVDKSLVKIQKHEAVEGEILAAAELIPKLAEFIGKFVDAYPPASLVLAGISAVLPVSYLSVN